MLCVVFLYRVCTFSFWFLQVRGVHLGLLVVLFIAEQALCGCWSLGDFQFGVLGVALFTEDTFGGCLPLGCFVIQSRGRVPCQGPCDAPDQLLGSLCHLLKIGPHLYLFPRGWRVVRRSWWNRWHFFLSGGAVLDFLVFWLFTTLCLWR